MTAKVSVIVPIYNVEAYLQRCFESLSNQTLREIEVILVNDGSTDNSLALCQKMIEKDKRFVLVNKENGGLSSARNAGLDICTGDYISFVDSDDWLEITMLEILYNTAQKQNADIVTCGINRIVDGNFISTSDNSGTIRVLTQKDYLELITFPEQNIRFEVWNKLFRKSVIGNNRFKKGQIYEDIYFERMVSNQIEHAVQINASLYNYVENRKGATNSSFKMARLGVFSELNDFSVDLGGRGFDLAKRRINLFAMDMAQQFYIALRSMDIMDGDKDSALATIKKSFNSLFHKEKNIPIKYTLFYISPSFYYAFWRMKNIKNIKK